MFPKIRDVEISLRIQIHLHTQTHIHTAKILHITRVNIHRKLNGTDESLRNNIY